MKKKRIQPARVFVFLPALLCLLNAGAPAGSLSWIDSAASAYSVAAGNYDQTALKNVSGMITARAIADRQKPQAALLSGLIYWRLELIAFCSNTGADMNRYGKLALEKLDEAEKAGADVYLAASHKALACQLLATAGIKNGALYGPRAASELKKAQGAKPGGYYSRLVEAINAGQAPSFAGGNPKKAALLLEKMATDFPDSADVKIHLAEVYGKVGRNGEGSRLIAPIVKAYPANLLARKVAAKLLIKY